MFCAELEASSTMLEDEVGELRQCHAAETLELRTEVHRLRTLEQRAEDVEASMEGEVTCLRELLVGLQDEEARAVDDAAFAHSEVEEMASRAHALQERYEEMASRTNALQERFADVALGDMEWKLRETAAEELQNERATVARLRHACRDHEIRAAQFKADLSLMEIAGSASGFGSTAPPRTDRSTTSSAPTCADLAACAHIDDLESQLRAVTLQSDRRAARE